MLADANNGAAGTHQKHRMSSKERREAIIEVAISVFGQHGFKGTTTRELAAAAGVSEPVLYQHFATKRELYTAIIDQLTQRVHDRETELLEHLEAANDDHGFLRLVAKAIHGWYEEEPDAVRLLLFSALEGHELSLMWRERVHEPIFGTIRSYMERRISQGRFRPVDATVASKLFVGAIAQYCQVTHLYRCSAGQLAPAEYLNQAVDLFLEGVRNKDRT